MSGDVPKWLTNFALDIYRVIQKHGAMDRFQEMVDKWASDHESSIKNRLEWQEHRIQHFQQLSLGNPRLLDEDAGPPQEGWRWETAVLHTTASPGSESESRTIVNAWVPPELSTSAEPEVCHPLPLSADHQLTLEERYAVLAAVYDVGRKGTEQIPTWEWPKNWGEEGALSNAKKGIFFEGLRRSVSELAPQDEGWLRVLLDVVEKDIEGQTGQDMVSTNKGDMVPAETRVEVWFRKAKNHPVISILIIIGAAIVAVGGVAGSLDTMLNFCSNHILGNDVARRIEQQDPMDRPIVSAGASVEINVRAEEHVNVHNMNRGIFMAFAKEREALLFMASDDSYARQIGNSTVRYSGNLRMPLTDKAFNQPLSILKDTRYIQLQVAAIPSNSEILSGMVNCAFNEGIPVRVRVPPQKMQGDRIMVRDIDFAELLKQE